MKMQKTELKEMIEETLKELLKKEPFREWMSLKEGAKYVGVCPNTFMKLRNRGLKISEIDGVKKVSKTEIDDFLKDNSF